MVENVIGKCTNVFVIEQAFCTLILEQRTLKGFPAFNSLQKLKFSIVFIIKQPILVFSLDSFVLIRKKFLKAI